MTHRELTQLRLRLGMSKQQLAQALGISVSRLTDYELGYTRGRMNPAPIPQMMVMALKGPSVVGQRRRAQPVTSSPASGYASR